MKNLFAKVDFYSNELWNKSVLKDPLLYVKFFTITLPIMGKITIKSSDIFFSLNLFMNIKIWFLYVYF